MECWSLFIGRSGEKLEGSARRSSAATGTLRKLYCENWWLDEK
jgi:hypothetical protein